MRPPPLRTRAGTPPPLPQRRESDDVTSPRALRFLDEVPLAKTANGAADVADSAADHSVGLSAALPRVRNEFWGEENGQHKPRFSVHRASDTGSLPTASDVAAPVAKKSALRSANSMKLYKRMSVTLVEPPKEKEKKSKGSKRTKIEGAAEEAAAPVKVTRWSRFLAWATCYRRVSPLTTGREMERGASKRIKVLTGRKLQSTGAARYSLLLPYLIWGVVAVVAFSVSDDLLLRAQTRIIDVDVVGRALTLATDIRLYSLELVMHSSSSTSIAVGPMIPGNVTQDRVKLAKAATQLLELQEALLMGSQYYGTVGSLRRSAAHDSLAFAQGCAAADSCAPITDPSYASVHFGLYSMTRWFAREALVLAMEPESALLPTSPRFQYLWQVGRRDMTSGMRAAASLFEADTEKEPLFIEHLQISLLVIIFCASMAFQVYVFRPWLQSTLKEAKMVAEMLSQVPQDVNIENMLEDALL